MTLADIHNDYPATAAMMRPSRQQTNTSGAQTQSDPNPGQAITGLSRKMMGIAKMAFVAGFGAASFIIAAVMIYAVMIGVPLISH